MLKRNIIDSYKICGENYKHFSKLFNCTPVDARIIVECAKKLNRDDKLNEQAHLIKSVCDKLKLNVTELAAHINYQRSSLQNVINGKRGLPCKQIKLLTKILDENEDN